MKRKALMIKIPKDSGMFYKPIPGNISNMYFSEIGRKCILFYECMAKVVFFICRVTQRVKSHIEYPQCKCYEHKGGLNTRELAVVLK